MRQRPGVAARAGGNQDEPIRAFSIALRAKN
jgi:hypothetical protein